MILYAVNEFTLSHVEKDGCTYKQHLENDYAQKLKHNPQAECPIELQPVDCDPAMIYLWEYFVEMSSRRGSSGFGKNPITELELQAWLNRKKIKLEQFEYSALDSIEAAFLEFQNKKD